VLQIFRQAPGHQPKGLPQLVNPVGFFFARYQFWFLTYSKDEETIPGIEHPGSTGVIYCSDRAMANGFSYSSSHEWSNLGQGAPEVGPIPGAPERPSTISMPTDSLEYAPTVGVKGRYTAAYFQWFFDYHIVQLFVKPWLIYITTLIVKENEANTRLKMSASSLVVVQVFHGWLLS